MRRLIALFLAAAIATGASAAAASLAADTETQLTLAPDDVIPTGNDWIALPSIRAGDAALMDFNVISMRYRGLIEFAGAAGQPLMKPFLSVSGVKKPLANLRWSLRDYWLPTGTMEADGVRTRISFVTPPESRAAIIRFQVTNLGSAPVKVAPGMEVNWARTHRVTYSPEPLKGSRTMSPTPVDSDMEVFNYRTDDTQFAWGFAYVGSQGVLHDAGPDPGVTAQHPATLAPGATLDMHYLIGVGLEEYSAAYAMRVLNKRIDRYGIDGVIDQAAAEARRHTRTTGRADLDRIMNRNLLFTTYYAWGRALDTEQFVGMTSRSNRYYVSAAYWDRDALLWSFPALLDSDPERAREALDYVFGVQARNIGIHSRFIDGVVLEDGLELDELVAPLVALKSYVDATGDRSLLDRYAPEIDTIRRRLFALRDPATGLYETFQDAEDEYVQKPFSIYDNVLTWKALNDLSALDKTERCRPSRPRRFAQGGDHEIRRALRSRRGGRADLRRLGQRDRGRLHGCPAGVAAEAARSRLHRRGRSAVRADLRLAAFGALCLWLCRPAVGAARQLSRAVHHLLVGRRSSPPESRPSEGAQGSDRKQLGRRDRHRRGQARERHAREGRTRLRHCRRLRRARDLRAVLHRPQAWEKLTCTARASMAC